MLTPVVCGSCGTTAEQDITTAAACNNCGADDLDFFEGAVHEAAIDNVSVWADGFGNWHAAVTEGNNAVGNSAAAEAAALAAIRAALAEREGQNFAPEVIGVVLDHRDSQDGKLTSYFTETNIHDASLHEAAKGRYVVRHDKYGDSYHHQTIELARRERDHPQTVPAGEWYIWDRIEKRRVDDDETDQHKQAELGEPERAMCPRCGTAQYNPAVGYCPQCGYRKTGSVTAERGPNGFWCRYCGDYQSVRNPAEHKKMRAHMDAHEKAGHKPVDRKPFPGDKSQRLSSVPDTRTDEWDGIDPPEPFPEPTTFGSLHVEAATVGNVYWSTVDGEDVDGPFSTAGEAITEARRYAKVTGRPESSASVRSGLRPQGFSGSLRSEAAALIIIPDNCGARDFSPAECGRQIGNGNILSISGGRILPIAAKDGHYVGVSLPVSNGYAVNIFLANDDTYTVQRVYRGKVKGEQTGVYAEDVGEAAYQAGMFQSNDFGGHIVGSLQRIAVTDDMLQAEGGHEDHVRWLMHQYALDHEAAEAEAQRRYEQYPDESRRWATFQTDATEHCAFPGCTNSPRGSSSYCHVHDVWLQHLRDVNSKLGEITAGILDTNPGMEHEAALKLAATTLERFPKLAGPPPDDVVEDMPHTLQRMVQEYQRNHQQQVT